MGFRDDCYDDDDDDDDDAALENEKKTREINKKKQQHAVPKTGVHIPTIFFPSFFGGSPESQRIRASVSVERLETMKHLSVFFFSFRSLF